MISLTYDSTTINLRSPKFGNKDIANRNRLSKRSKGGDTIHYIHPLWPQQRELVYDFDTLTRTEAINLRDFIKLSLGRTVSLTDHEGRIWSGIISTPDVSIKEDRDDCDYSTSLTFLVVP